MPGTFEPGDFITVDVDVDLWFCSGYLFLILDRDQEESTDRERQRRTISLAFLSVLKRIALETKVSSWAYEWKVRTTVEVPQMHWVFATTMVEWYSSLTSRRPDCKR